MGWHSHKWTVDASKVVRTETWYRSYDGKRLEGSDYDRHISVTVEKCSKCGKERAFKGYANEDRCYAERLSPEYARQLIAEHDTVVKKNKEIKKLSDKVVELTDELVKVREELATFKPCSID